jgi:hypothetical protein
VGSAPWKEDALDALVARQGQSMVVVRGHTRIEGRLVGDGRNGHNRTLSLLTDGGEEDVIFDSRTVIDGVEARKLPRGWRGNPLATSEGER